MRYCRVLNTERSSAVICKYFRKLKNKYSTKNGSKSEVIQVTDERKQKRVRKHVTQVSAA